MSKEYKNIKALGLETHGWYVEPASCDWVSAEDLEKLLAALHRIYYHPTGKKFEGSLSPEQRSEDRYTALLLDIKPIEKPKPKRKVTLYKWETVVKTSDGAYGIKQKIFERSPETGEVWTKVPGSERVVEVDDE